MKYFKTIWIFALCLLVLLSSSSFVVGFHYCNGTVKNIALLTKAERCMHEQEKAHCHKHVTKSCCEDEVLVHDGDDQKVEQHHLLTSNHQLALIDLISVVIAEVIPDAPVAKQTFLTYDPPLPVIDRVVSLRTILI